MKQLYKKLYLVLTISALLFVSCSKEDTQEETSNQETQYALVTTETLPGDVVELKSNNPTTATEIDVIINDTSVKAYANGEYSYVFIMPVLASGNYDLKLPAIDKDLTLKLKVKDYMPITDPEEIIDAFVVNRDESFEEISKLGTSPETLLLIEQIKEEWALQYANISKEEKIQLAYILQKNTINSEWFDESTKLPENYYSKSGLAFFDAGDKLVSTAKEFITFQNICVGSIPFLIGSGYAFISFPNPVSALVFVGVFTTFVVSREAAIIKAKEVGSLKGVAESVSDISYKKNTTLQLAKDVNTDISMAIAFRNLKMSDVSIQRDVTQAFNEEKEILQEDNKVKILYDKAIKYTKKLKGLYKGYTSAIGTSAEKSMTLTVQDKDIIIQGSSNPEVTISTTLVDGVRKIKATSTSTEDINFNLKVAYKRAIDGKEMVKEIPSVYIAKASLIGIWELESFEDGVPAGQFSNVYHSDCQNIVIQQFSFITDIIEFKETTWTSNSTSKYIYYYKDINVSTCSVTNDYPDQEMSYSDSTNGTYVLKGNILEITGEDGVDSGAVTFITANKIKLFDSIYIRK